MNELEIMKGILDSYPYQIVFVDNDLIIRFMNKYAEFHYYTMRGYSNLIGKNLMECHDFDSSKEKIISYYKKMQSDGKAKFVGINEHNQRLYMQPVKNDNGEWIGFFERIELNMSMDIPYTMNNAPAGPVK